MSHENKANQRRLALAIDNSVDVLVEISLDGNVYCISSGIEGLTGRNAESLHDTSIFSIVCEQDRKSLRENLSTLSLENSRLTKTFRIIHHDLREIWVESTFTLMDAPRAVVPHRIVMVLRDVSERRRSREDYDIITALAHIFVESVDDHAIYMIDPNGIVKTWNVGAERIKGYTPNEVIGTNFSRFFTDDDITKGEPLRILQYATDHGMFQSEGWRVRKNGSKFWASIMLYSMRDREENIIGFAKITQDITEQKKVKNEYENLIHRFNIACNVANIGIWEWDIETNVLTWNSIMFQLYGRQEGEICPSYQVWSDSLHPDDREITEKTIANASLSGEPFKYEFRIIWPNGVIRYMNAQASVVYDEESQHRRMIGINLDTTEIRTLSADLHAEKNRAEDANRAKSEFLANMSHEIRTPMNGIIGIAEILLETELTSDQSRYLKLLCQSAQSLLVIINDILDISKVEAGKIEFQAIPINLKSLIDGAVSVVYQTALEKDIAVEVSIAPNVPEWITGDPTRLRQIILNFLSNALKFTEHGTVSIQLKVELHENDPFLRFEVRDTGAGIPLDKQHLLFEKFSQIDPSNVNKFGGTGLGLAISKQLVEAMLGTIGVDSELHCGSTFWFSIPLIKTNQIANESSRTSVISKLDRRILLVEDNAINQIVAKTMLEQDGHTVVLASNGAEAVEIVKAQYFDLILMDMQMPIMDGVSATRKIRALAEPLCHIPIVALTANAMSDQVDKCREAGMNDHLAKPIDRSLLREAIATWGSTFIEHQSDVHLHVLQQGIEALTDLFNGDRENVLRVLQAALTSIKVDSERIENALVEQDLSELSEAAHRMRGTSISIGAGSLGELGQTIETSSQADHVPVTDSTLLTLHEIISEIDREIAIYARSLLK